MPARTRMVGATVVATATCLLFGVAPSAAYTVRRGDTLSEIAARHGVSVRSLADGNGISDIHRVVAGQSLTIPGTAAATTAGPSATSGGHVVRPGETLSGIASRHGVSVTALAGANGITDVHHVRFGVRLTVPGAGGSTAGAGPAVPTPEATSGFPSRLRSSPQRLALVPTFDRWAAHYGVPPSLLMAMTWLESGWQNHVVSPVGAMGIGQLMPDTVTWMRDVLIGLPLDPASPDDNIRMSARYLRWLLDRFGGDERLALAGYYQGPAAVTEKGVYPHTEPYVANVLAFRSRHFSR